MRVCGADGRCASRAEFDPTAVLPACDLTDKGKSWGWLEYQDVNEVLASWGVLLRLGAFIARGLAERCCDDEKHRLEWADNPTVYRLAPKEDILAADVAWRLRGRAP